MHTLAVLTVVFSFAVVGSRAEPQHRCLTRHDVDPRRYDIPLFFPEGDTLRLFNDGSNRWGQLGNESELRFGPIPVRRGTKIRLTGRYRITAGGQARLFVRLFQQVEGRDSWRLLSHDPSNRSVELKTVGKWARFAVTYTIAVAATHASPSLELVPDNDSQEP